MSYVKWKEKWQQPIIDLIIRIFTSICFGLWLNNIWAGIFVFNFIIVIMILQDRKNKFIQNFQINSTDPTSFKEFMENHRSEMIEMVKSIRKEVDKKQPSKKEDESCLS